MANDKSGFWEQTKMLAQSAFRDIGNSYQEILLQDSAITPNHQAMEEIEQSVHQPEQVVLEQDLQIYLNIEPER